MSETLVYDAVPSPVGPLVLVVSATGLRGLHIGDVADVHAAWGGTPGRGPARDIQAVRPFAQQLAEYFVGSRRVFDLPLDLSGVRPFGQAVLRAALEIRFGSVASYREIAAQLGTPSAARAVGGALARNPIPIIVPCHRVLRSDGSLAGYVGGSAVKRFLLRHEGVLLVA